MSIQYLTKQVIPNEQRTIRVNDCIVSGHSTVAEYLNVTGNLSTLAGLKVGTAITHDNIPAANILQATSITTAINATAVANPYNFNVSSETATTAAGGEETFFLNMPSNVLNSLGFASVSVYYYSGVVGTAGIPVLSIVTQESDRVTMVLRNVHASNALNGNIHFRFKYELGEN